MKTTSRSTSTFLAFFVSAGLAGATTITSTTYGGWESEVTSYYDVGMPSSGSYNTSAGVTLSNASAPSSKFVFSGPDNGNWFLTGQLYTTGGHNYPALYGAADGAGEILITMPSGGENAVLVNIASTQGTSLTINLSDGESFSQASGILGLSISHDVSWLSISTSNGSQPIIDDFMFANSDLTQDQFTQQPAPAIEASTLIMIGGGLFLLAGGRRKFFANLVN